MDSEASQKISLQVIFENEIIFQSYRQWLYPLFDLEDHFEKYPIDMSRVEIRDKVIGKASAILIVRLGVGRVHGNLTSELAIGVLKKTSILFTFDKLVKKIDCRTEEILLEVNDIDVAYNILCKRANRC